MIRAGAHQRQAECDVNALFYAEVLHRDQALVVVHRHHRVKLAGLAAFAACAHENRIGCKRATDLQTMRASGSYGRRNDVNFFASKQSTLAGVWIQARDTDAVSYTH